MKSFNLSMGAGFSYNRLKRICHDINTPKFILIAGLLVVVILFFTFGLGHYFTLENLKEHQLAFQDYYQQNKFMTIAREFQVDPFVCRLQKTDGLIA